MTHKPNKHSDGLIVVVMGVSGCGKSTITQLLAERLNAHGKDGDELHPPQNIERMSNGVPLTDEDRKPWLEAVRDYASTHAQAEGICVIACSALKQRYRDLLDTAGNVMYLFLEGSRELIASRMHLRTGHFMPETLLASQFAALEAPGNDANAITISIEPDPATIADNAAAALRQHPFYQASLRD